MKLSIFFRYASTLILVILLGLLRNVYAQEALKPKMIGEPAPALHISRWLKGEKIESFQKGHVYVVEFWATWCKPCIAGMPHLSELAEKYQKNVTVLGISIMERAGTSDTTIRNFVSRMGNKMDYTVAMEEGKLMAENWLKAYGERSIPHVFIVDQQGLIAWVGAPMHLDSILPLIISGKWNIAEAAAKRQEWQRLSAIDNNIIPYLNTFMGNPGNHAVALAKIDSIISRNPGIKYYPMVGHYTFWSLIKTDPEKAYNYAKYWLAASDYPKYSTVTDAVTGRSNLPPSLYILAAECYQAQLDRYPWSMNFPDTYKKMAALYHQGGNNEMAAVMLKKSAGAEGAGKSIN